MKIREIRFKSDGHNLYGFYEAPEKTDKPIVLMLHGLTNSLHDCPLIEDVAKKLHNKGFPTFRFDYFGSGRSDGLFKDKLFSIMAKNTEDAFNYALKSFGGPIILWGRSLGAIFASIISGNKNVSASIFISSGNHTTESFKGMFPKKGGVSIPFAKAGTGKIKGDSVLPYRFYEETSWIDKIQKQRLKKAKNVLVVQGTTDKTIYNQAWAKEIYNLTNKPKKLVYIEGADHAYHGREKKVIDLCVEWIALNSPE